MAIAKFRRFQVYGQRCSGTKVLIKFLERNLEELEFTEDFGFKHWLVWPDIEIPDDDVFVIAIPGRSTSGCAASMPSRARPSEFEGNGVRRIHSIRVA